MIQVRQAKTNILLDDKGETLVETMISVLISALALLLLSTAIGASVNIVRTSKDALESHYTAEGKLVTPGPGNVVSLDTSGDSVTFEVSPYAPPNNPKKVIAYGTGEDNTYRYVAGSS